MKKIIGLCAVIILLAAVSLSAYAESGAEAETVYSFAERAGEGELSELSMPEDAVFYSEKKAEDKEDGDKKDGDTGEENENAEREKRITSDGGKISFLTNDGKTYAKAEKADGKDKVSVRFSMDGMECPALTECMGFVFKIDGESVSGAVSPYAQLTVRMKTAGGEYSASVPVSVNGCGRFYADVAGIDCNGITSVTVELTLTEGVTGVTELTLSEPYVTDAYDFTFQKKQSFEYISVVGGNMEADKISLTVWDDGGRTDILVGCETGTDKDAPRRVRYASVGCENECSVSVRDADSTSKALTEVKVDADLPSAVFRLNGCPSVFVSITGEGKITVDELKLCATSAESESSLHPLSVLSVTEGKLAAGGTLDRQTVKKYAGCSIGLFRIPAAGDAEPEQVAHTRVTSRFSFEAEVSAAAYDYMYYAAIIDKNDEYVRISPPQFLSAAGTKSDVRSLYGLYGADPISVYEAGAAYAMVDVDLTRLTSPEKVSGITAARGGYVFGLNSEYVDELDSYMELYRTAGISVYVKLYCSDTIKSKYDDSYLTYRRTSSEYMLRSDTPEAAGMYTAVVSYLCKRYPNITSFVLSSGVNSVDLTGMSYTDKYKSAENIAMAARLIYGAASEISDVFITVPVCDVRDRYDVTAELLLSLVAEKLMHVGHIPWAVMYTGEECELPEISDSIISLQRMNNTSAASYAVYCYSPRVFDAAAAEGYKALCKSAESTPTRTVFLSEMMLDEKPGREVLNGLNRDMKGAGTHLFTSEAQLPGDAGTSEVKGTYTVWDFSSVHSTLGWVGGYGIEKLSSTPEALFGSGSHSRVLRCVTADRADGAGIVMCRQEFPVNLSTAPLVEFRYSYECDTDVSVVFVFANGENRAEFKAPSSIVPDEDGTYTAVCDLTEFSKVSTVAYVGVLIYSDSAATFDLSHVNVMSGESEDGEIARLFEVKEQTEEESIPVLRIAAGALLILVTVTVGAVCIMHARRRDEAIVNVIKKRRRR